MKKKSNNTLSDVPHRANNKTTLGGYHYVFRRNNAAYSG